MDSDTEYTEYNRTDVSETDIASPPRPGRFKGPKSTWRTFNEDEIALADSLVKLGAQDLSEHLYNTHVMKKSLYDADLMKDLKPWSSKERWRPAEVGDDGKNFVPPERWTAWPLEPEIVPRGEGTKVDEEFTLKRADEQKPSRELEEVLTGVILKFAKGTFENRKWESDESLQSSSERDSSSASQDSQEEGWKEDDDLNPTDSEAPAQPSLEHPSSSKPIISADDDRSARLLRPTVRHTIARLDSLLTALQISRRACLRRERSPSPTSGDPFSPAIETDDLPTTPDSPKRRQGRPRREIIHQPHPLAASSPPKKSKRGRPRKVHAPLPGETQTEMLVRIAREQHKSIPFAADSPRSSTPRSTQSRSRSRTQSRSQSRSRSRSSSRGSRARLGVRDWSEVIGAAALVGWPEEVVERAGRRCATLFGEGMGVRVLTEGVKGGDVREEMYLPEEVPDFGELSEEGEEEMEDSLAPRRSRSARMESRTRSRSRSRESRSRAGGKSAIGRFGIYAAYCLVKECGRYERGFNNQRAARNHLRSTHGLGRDEIEKLEEEGEMIGGVHRDGFGVVVKRRQGWRGGDEGLRKEKKKMRGKGGRSGVVGASVVGDESEKEEMEDDVKNEDF